MRKDVVGVEQVMCLVCECADVYTGSGTISSLGEVDRSKKLVTKV